MKYDSTVLMNPYPILLPLQVKKEILQLDTAPLSDEPYQLKPTVS